MTQIYNDRVKTTFLPKAVRARDMEKAEGEPVWTEQNESEVELIDNDEIGRTHQ